MLPKGWAEEELGYLTSKIGSGATPRGGRESYSTDGTPLIRSMNVHFAGFRTDGLAFINEAQARLLDNVEVEPDDVLLNITGASIGRVCSAPAEYAGARVNQHVCILRVFKGVLPRYVERFLAAPKMQSFILEQNYGLTRQALTKEMVESIKLPLPPLAEQRRIVEKLDALTARLARARAELERVPSLAASLRSIALSAKYRALSRQGGTSPVEDLIAALDQGWSPKCENYPAPDEASWGVLKTTAIQALAFRSSENKALPDHLSPRPKIEVQEGDILVTRAGPRVRCGITCLVPKTRSKLMLADKMYRLRCRPDRAVSEYVAMMLNAPESLVLIESMKTGISDSGLNLTQDKFLSIPIPNANVDKQREIVEQLRLVFARADRLEAESARARALLDRLEAALLAKAFRGELVPQDPADEPASVLLDRIRAERAPAPKAKRGRRTQLAQA